MVMLGVLLPALFVAFVAVSASDEEEAYVSNFDQMWRVPNYYIVQHFAKVNRLSKDFHLICFLEKIYDLSLLCS